MPSDYSKYKKLDTRSAILTRMKADAEFAEKYPTDMWIEDGKLYAVMDEILYVWNGESFMEVIDAET